MARLAWRPTSCRPQWSACVLGAISPMPGVGKLCWLLPTAQNPMCDRSGTPIHTAYTVSRAFRKRRI